MIDLLPTPPPNKTGWPWTEIGSVNKYEATHKWPSVSIIVPSFNQGQFIEETIRSILLQRYPHLELIIIDGGSTDNTIPILKKYEKWITYWVSEKDNGQCHALNKGLAIAKGDYIGWQNSDDIFYPGALKVLASICLNYDVVYTSIFAIDEHSRKIDRLYFVPFNAYLLRYYSIVYSNQAALFRGLLLKQLLFREDLNYAMDFELQFRLNKAGARFKFVKGFWGAIRFHSDAKTVKEFYNKVKLEEAKVRMENGMKIDPSVSLWRQYFLQYTLCLVYVAFWRAIYGGLVYRLKKYLHPPINYMGEKNK